MGESLKQGRCTHGGRGSGQGIPKQIEHTKAMGSDEMHPQVMRELAYIIAGPLSITFKQS